MTDDTGDRVFLKTLSRRRAGNFSEKFFLPARVKKVLENKCHKYMTHPLVKNIYLVNLQACYNFR